MILIFVPVQFDSAAANKVAMLPIFKTNLCEATRAVEGTKTEIDQMILSREVKMVTNEPSETRKQNSPEKQIIMQAKKDLACRLSVKDDRIKLLEVRQVTWPDSSLGCPQSGKIYNQVPQDGLLIRLEVEGRMYFYHSGGTLDPFLCEKTSQIVPHPTKIDEFIPPPGPKID